MQLLPATYAYESGLLADLPTPTIRMRNLLYLATDDGPPPGTWYICDGSDWTQLSSGATGGASAAEDVSVDSTTLVGTGTDVQAVLEELDNGIADHLADGTDAHAGSAITNTPAGNIAATTVQAAINELDSEKAAASHSHSGADITSGTVVDARIDSAIARDSEVAAAYVAKTLADANSVLYAVSDDTPAALAMGASTILARLAAGNIVAATPSEIRTLLALVVGTNVQAWSAALDAIAALSPSNDDVLQRKAGSWTNRSLTQLIADLDAIQETLIDAKGDLIVGSAADTAARLPVGGTNGHVLTVDSGQSLGVKWAAQTGGGGSVATDAIFDAKGDLPVGTGADTASKLAVGSDGQVLTADAAQATGVKWAAAALGSVTWDARSSNTILAAGDKGKAIDCTAAFTQTLTAAATLGAGWWCYIRNGGSETTVLVIDPNSAEQIDGLTTLTMYSGDTRLLVCDGSGFKTYLLKGGTVVWDSTSSPYTWTKPSGVTSVDVVCIGGGGGGGGGMSKAATAGSGGAGGGGGAVTRATYRAADLGATETVTVGSGGGSGTAAGGANGGNGGNGGVTSFGSHQKAGGGGGGIGGANAVGSTGGAGGGVLTSAATTTVGTPSGAANSSGIAGQGAGATASAGNAGNPADWGGASGSGSDSAGTGKAGTGSIYGGAGGGGGGGVTAGNAGQTSGAGGSGPAYSAANGGGGAAGTSGGSPTNGTAGSGALPYCGSGGGGGGAGSSQPGKPGGQGGVGSGGGGGGAGNATGGGTGGQGGSGRCIITYS